MSDMSERERAKLVIMLGLVIMLFVMLDGISKKRRQRKYERSQRKQHSSGSKGY